MKTLLEPTLIRQLLLLDTLHRKREKVSLSKLSQLTNSSESTILRDIHYLQKKFSQHISIERDNQKNIQLKQTDSKNITFVQNTILDNSLNINIIKTILLNPFNPIEYYSDVINVSTSSIYKSIKTINNTLLNYQIEIRSLSGRYFFMAESEIILRKLFSLFWLEINLSNDTLIKIDNYDDIKLYWNNNQTPNILNNKFIFSYYLSFNFISSLRFNQKFYINSKFFEDENTIEQITKSLIYSPFDNNKYFYNRSFYRLIDYLKKDLFNTKNMNDFYPFFYLIKKIYENEISHQIPINLFINPISYFNYQLVNNAYVYRIILDIIKNIESIIKIDLTQYHPIITYVLIVYYSDIIKSYNILTSDIYIYSFLSDRHANFLKYQLNNHFNEKYCFKIISKEDIAYLNENDVLISNDPLLKKKNTLLVNDYINEIEFLEIKQKLLNN